MAVSRTSDFACTIVLGTLIAIAVTPVSADCC
jgi:hypothetical protein